MLNRLITHLRNYDIRKKKVLYLLSIVILFWALFDGIVSYIVPILITDTGISKTLMGIIIGTSSVAGALFDFIACKFFRTTHYRHLFIIMFALCFGFPLLLFYAHSFGMFVIAMAIWGIYYDLRMIGTFNYVGRFTHKEEHSESFGVLQVFPAIGYLIAPLMVGFLVADSFHWEPFALAWIFLALSIIFFLILISVTQNDESAHECDNLDALPTRGTWAEVVVWSKVGHILLPVLAVTFFLNFSDSFFWTLGPLVAEGLPGIAQFGGIFMTIYTLPPLIVGWFVGSFTRRYGKKRTSFLCLLYGSLMLIFFAFLSHPLALIADVFLISLFMSLAYPAINGAYADYISESTMYEKEIEGLEDFYTNVGYIIGPMSAGFIADQLSIGAAFSLLGVCGVGVAILLLLTTKRHIKIPVPVDTLAYSSDTPSL